MTCVEENGRYFASIITVHHSRHDDDALERQSRARREAAVRARWRLDYQSGWDLYNLSNSNRVLTYSS
jgi:hypothetical protein